MMTVKKENELKESNVEISKLKKKVIKKESKGEATLSHILFI